MRKFAVLLLVAVLMVVVGCGKTVKRVDTDEQIDLSGRWNDTDSRLVSESMIQDVLSRPWIFDYRAANQGKAPVLIVGRVRNRSNEHISVETFVKDLERALVNSGEVDFVASSSEREELRDERRDQAYYASGETAKAMGEETGADYMLKGVLNSIKDKEGGKSVIFYQVNLELIHLQSNKKVWIGEKKIKKFVKRSRWGL